MEKARERERVHTGQTKDQRALTERGLHGEAGRQAGVGDLPDRTAECVSYTWRPHCTMGECVLDAEGPKLLIPKRINAKG